MKHTLKLRILVNVISRTTIDTFYLFFFFKCNYRFHRAFLFDNKNFAQSYPLAKSATGAMNQNRGCIAQTGEERREAVHRGTCIARIILVSRVVGSRASLQSKRRRKQIGMNVRRARARLRTREGKIFCYCVCVCTIIYTYIYIKLIKVDGDAKGTAYCIYPDLKSMTILCGREVCTHVL